MKKVNYYIIIGMMIAIATCFTACGNEKGDSNNVKYKDTLRVEVWDRGELPKEYGTVTDNRWTRYIQENFGDPNGILIEYVATDREQEKTKIYTWMMNEKAPDIIFTYDNQTFYNYASAGKLADLTEAIQEYGPNITHNLENVLYVGQYDGVQYAVNSQRVLRDYTAHYIRKDWLDQLGYHLERNEDGFYHMSIEDLEWALEQFKKNDLDGTGQEIYPLGLTGQDSQWRTICGFFDVFFDGNQLNEEIMATKNYINWPGFKECMRWLNKMYLAGMIDPMYATKMDAAALGEDIIAGNVGYWTTDSWFGMDSDGYLDRLKEKKPDAEVVAIQLENVNGTQMNRVYNNYGMYVMVPSFSTKVDLAVKYMNWLADIDNSHVLGHGIEGEHYFIENGVEVEIDSKYNAASRINVYDLNLLATYANDVEKQIKCTLQLTDNWKELREDTIRINFINPYSDIVLNRQNNSQVKYGNALDNKRMKLFINCIMAAEGTFDGVYDSLIEDYMNCGGGAVEAEARMIYKEMNN